MTSFLFQIVTHTPLWVWAGLAVLVLYGLQQTRTRTVGAPRLWLVPIVMGGYSFLGTWSAFGGAGQVLAIASWIVGAALGFASNRSLDLPRQVSANADGTFRVGGSFAPLVLFVSIFLLRYAIGVMLAVAPAFAHEPMVALLASLASGLPTGLLIARSRKVLSTRRPSNDMLAA